MKGIIQLVACLIPTFIAFTALYFAPKAVASPLIPRAPSTSNMANCAYVCPPTDQVGFPLGQHNPDDSNIFCSYPTEANQDPSRFSCHYDSADGHLIEDYDEALCPAAASRNCPLRDVSPTQAIVLNQNIARTARQDMSAIRISIPDEEYTARREKKLQQGRKMMAEV